MASRYLYNRDVRHHYDIIETFEAGIELLGFEVKAIKSGLGSLNEAFVVTEPDGLFITKMYLPPYQPKNTPPNYDPYQKRRLLVTKDELKKWSLKKKAEGLTLVPISLYNKNSLIKVELALVRGKKKFDKRQTIKQREADREISRTLKHQRE